LSISVTSSSGGRYACGVASETDDIAYLFRVLAELDYRGASPLYERLALAAADDPDILRLLLPAARHERLSHLLFAAVQFLLLAEGSGPLEAFEGRPYDVFRDWCLARRGEIEALVATRFVQTNEVGRCASLVLCLASVAARSGRPLAVLEVGTSAGLNLGFDRYRYVFDGDSTLGAEDAGVVLAPRVVGRPIALHAMPPVVWRRGLDRSPVDVTDDDAVRWLRACIWPEQAWRRELFDRAVTVNRTDPPEIVTGDAVTDLAAAVADAPTDAALCILHSALMQYVADRPAFVAALRDVAAERPVWWISGEPPGLVRGLPEPPTPTEGIAFLYGVVPLGVDAEPRLVARAGGHGGWVEWLDVG
jgi:hypothetical protein